MASQHNPIHVIWTPTAELSYSLALEEIYKRWTITEVINFMELVDDFVKKLAAGIIQGKISKKTNLRSFVISKQTTLYFDYFEAPKRIELLLFWNNRKDPKTLKKILQSR